MSRSSNPSLNDSGAFVRHGGGDLGAPAAGTLDRVFADFALRGAFWFFAAGRYFGALALVFLPKQPVDGKTGQKWPPAPLLMLSAATLLIAFAGVAQSIAVAVVECLAGVGLLAMAAGMDRRSDFRMLPIQTLDLRHPVGAGLLTVFAL